MDFIVSEFINLIKRCSNGLALEKEIWRRGIELQCQAFAQALETYDAEMARQYAGKQEVLRIDPAYCALHVRDGHIFPPSGPARRRKAILSFG